MYSGSWRSSFGSQPEPNEHKNYLHLSCLSLPSLLRRLNDEVVVGCADGSASRCHSSHVKRYTPPDLTAVEPAEHADQPVCGILMPAAFPRPQRIRVWPGYLKGLRDIITSIFVAFIPVPCCYLTLYHPPAQESTVYGR